MKSLITTVAWISQLYAAKILIVSAYRKSSGFQRVTDEFLHWGYPYPDKIVFFLIVVWVLGAFFLLIPTLAGAAAVALLPFMLAAFCTLMAHKEFRRLREPALPIVLLSVVSLSKGCESLLYIANLFA